MALVLADRVRETTTTAGNGTVTLNGAVLGFQTFSVIGNGNTTYYCIAGQGTTEWEVGIGTYTASGTTLARTTVLSSSNAGALVVFSSGTKDVFVTYPSGKSINYGQNGGVIITEAGTVDALRVTNTGTGNSFVVEDSTNPDSTPFVVTNAGLVGIGTTSAAASLDIGSVPTASTPVLRLLGNNGGGTVQNLSGLQYYWNLSGGFAESTLVYGNTTNSYLTFGKHNGTSYSQQMVIDSSGNLGIGTTTPSSKLDVTVTSATAYSTGVLGNGLRLYNNSATTGQYVGISFYGEPTSGSYGGATIMGTTTGNGSMDLTFTTRNGGVFGERMRIDSAGNVNCFDNNLTRVDLQDFGYVYFNSSTTNALDYVNGSHQRWAPNTGAQTLTISNWPPSGNLGELLIEGVNLGAATITWPTINWITSNGTTTTIFANNGVTLQTSGTDWILLWTRDAGTTIYGKVVR